MLTDDQRREICAILALGGTRRLAAACVGCRAEAIGRAARRDREFRRQLEAAEARAELRLLAALAEAARSKSQWRAAAWLLERRAPGRYAARAADTIPLQQLAEVLAQFADHLLAEVPAEQRAAVLRRLETLAADLARPRARKARLHALPPEAS